MVLPDDVKEIRRTLEDSVDEKKTEIATSSVKRFGVSMLFSSTVLCLLVVLILSGNLVLAGVSISEVGGFNAEIERVEGTGVTMYPVVGETSVCKDESGASADPAPDEEALPMLRVEVDGASIGQYQSVSFQKDINTPDVLDIAGIRISVTRPTGFGNEVELGDAAIQLTRLDANEIHLENDLVIDDRNDTTTFGNPTDFGWQDPGGEFIFEGQDAYIEDAEAVVHYVSFSSLAAPQLRFEMQYIQDENNLNYAERVDCPIAGASVLVNLDDTNEPIDPGETLNVTTTFINPSSTESVTSWAYLDVGSDTSVDSEYVSLSGGASETATLSYDVPSGIDAGEHDVTVRSDHDEATETVLIGDPAFFDVAITDTTTAEPGEDMLVNATIENTGDASDEQSVELDVDGVLRDSTVLELSGGEQIDETFVWETGDNQTLGNYSSTVASEDASDQETVQVSVSGDYFDVNMTDTNSPVVEGNPLDVDFEATNLGQASGTQELNLSIYEDPAAETPYEVDADLQTETLDPGESTSGQLVWQTQQGDEGSYYAFLGSEDTVVSESVNVGEPPNFNVTIDSTNEPISETETLTVDAYIQNTGGVPDTQTVTLDVENEGQVDSQSVTRNASENETVTLEWQTQEGDFAGGAADVRTVTVSSDDDADDSLIELQEMATVETPIRTQQNFTDLGESFEDTGDPDSEYGVDSTDSFVEGASGYLETLGTSGSGYGQVSWTQDVSNRDTLSFYAQGGRSSSLSSTYAAAQVLVDGDLLWERTSDFSWEYQEIDLSGYTGDVDIEFRLDVRGTAVDGRGWNFDNVFLYDETAPDAEAVDPAQVPPNSTGISSGFEHLDRFVFGDSIDTDTDSSQSYRDFTQDTSQIQVVTPGETVDVQNMTTGGSFDSGVAIWMDANQDGSFDQNAERLFDRDVEAPPTTFTGTVTIPSDAQPGATTLRAFGGDSNGSEVDPEGYGGWAEMQDFTVYVPDVVAEGGYWNSLGPSGWAHDGDWMHDNRPISEGETRTYVYYEMGSTGDIQGALRDGIDSDPSGQSSDIDNNLVIFDGTRYTPGDNETVEVEVDYSDSSQVVVRIDGSVMWTYDASGDNEVYWSTYEWTGGTGADSMRLLTW